MARKDKKKKEKVEEIEDTLDIEVEPETEEKIEVDSSDEGDLTHIEEVEVGGLAALVKIKESIDLEQNHDANILSLGFKGRFNVINPSSEDRIWDIELSLKNIESTTLETEEIKIRELGT